MFLSAEAPQRRSLAVENVAGEQKSYVSLSGRLVWNDDATVRVFTPFAGIIRALPVNVNERVAKGAPLAEIYSGDFAQAQADARKTASDYWRQERNFNRVRDLFEHGAAPRKDLEAAEADFAAARADRDRAESRLAIYGERPGASNRGFLLPSPLDGLLVERNVTPGQEVRPDQMLANLPQFTSPLFVVSDPTTLWVWLDVTEAHLPLLEKGLDLLVRSKTFPGQTFKARLDLIGDSLDPVTRTVRARGIVNNPEGKLRAEQYVSVEIPESTALQVPAKAVFLRDNQYYVFLETRDGNFERQPVRLGSEREGRVAINAGLKQGQRVVTRGGLLLQSLLDGASRS